MSLHGYPLISLCPQQSQVAKKAGPTIIIFIVGGMTYSEMRAIYEVSKATTDCEVVLGECVSLQACPLLLKNHM